MLVINQETGITGDLYKNDVPDIRISLNSSFILSGHIQSHPELLISLSSRSLLVSLASVIDVEWTVAAVAVVGVS